MKQIVYSMIGICLYLFLATSHSVFASENEYTYYEVQKGDTLWAIAQKYKIEVNELKQINQLNNDVIHIGQSLTIPIHTDINGQERYIVKKGDSLWTIADTYQIPISQLKRDNQLTSNILQIGQILVIAKHNSSNEEVAQVDLYGIELFEQLAYLSALDVTLEHTYPIKNTIKQAQVSISSNHHREVTKPNNQIELPEKKIKQNKPKITYSDEDFKWLAAIIEAEAEDQPYLGKVAVGSVIMNRIDSESFPDSIKEVIFQKTNKVYQFSPVGNGRIYRVKPSEDSIKAAQAALNGQDPTNGALFFYNPKIAKSKWIFTRDVAVVIGEHNFAY